MSVQGIAMAEAYPSHTYYPSNNLASMSSYVIRTRFTTCSRYSAAYEQRVLAGVLFRFPIRAIVFIYFILFLRHKNNIKFP